MKDSMEEKPSYLFLEWSLIFKGAGLGMVKIDNNVSKKKFSMKRQFFEAIV